ncbi:hypothetical protein ACOBQJ_13045 [Pelotomaculum propionicicum]|uniref:hypothetical protein n=1 Tax=Pelotomaculum propionicicum TaxID=258475 RepID=UPI003B7918F6
MNIKCFGGKGKNGCEILVVRKCPGDSCSYFKTKYQHQTDIGKTLKLLASLDKEHQQYIADKYYRGKKPWLEGGASNDR